MEENNIVVNPGDSISNKGSEPMEDALKEIKEIELEKNKGKEKTPIPQSIIFSIFGIISCFLSYIETSLKSSLLFSYKNKDIDKSKLFLEVIKYISLFIISLIKIAFKVKKPCIYQIILPFLFSFISYTSTYLYSRNAQTYVLLSQVFCIIFVSIYFTIINIINVKKNHTYELPLLAFIGLSLAILGILIEFVSSYFITINNGEDNIRFIYHHNDYINYILSLSNGICYAVIILLFDYYCKTIEIVFDTLMYIGLLSGLICFSLSFYYSEIKKIGKTFSEFGSLQINYYILTVVMYLFNIILQTILIKKCSIYSAGIIISSQISIRNIVDMIKYEEKVDSNIFTMLSLLLCFVGLYLICFYYISHKFNENKKQLENTESFASNTDNQFALISPSEND
jgi:hypothetical protein